MAYCVIADLSLVMPEAEIIKLTDDTGSGSINATTAQWAVDTAADVIDAYIGQVVVLPLSITPAPLKKINQDLAICNLFARFQSAPPEHWKTRCKEATDYLEAVADGKRSLTPTAVSESAAGAVQVYSRTQLFTAVTLDKF